MGISWSSRRRQNHYYHHHQHPSYYHPNPPPQPPPLPPPYYYHPSSTSSSSTAVFESSPLSLPAPPPAPAPAPPPPPPPPSNYVYVSNAPYPTNHFQYQHPPSIQSNYNYPGWSNSYNYANHMMGRPNFPATYGNGWHQMRFPPPQSSLLPPPYVEHQSAKVVKNDVNVHKDTIKLEVDENYPDHFLVSFVFDAHYDGSITIYYFAKEEKETCSFTPAYPEGGRSVKVPFRKGVGQRFRQATGTGVDLGFFDLESLGKPSEDDVFPLVIFAEVYSTSQEADDVVGESSAEGSPRVQVTQAVIETKNDGSFLVKAIRQILYIDGVRYELRDLYGIGNSSSEGFNDDDPGKECVICMTEPKNTAVMPCRHLCMCSDCAKELRLQTNKCPICRQPISELIEIKINNTDSQ